MKRYDELILMIKAQGTSVRQDDYLDELGGIIEQLQRERDEVMKSMYVKSCDSCKYNQCSIFDEPCYLCNEHDRWEWRGVDEQPTD